MKGKQLRFLASIMMILLAGFTIVGCSSGDSESDDTRTTHPIQLTDVIWEWENLQVTTGFDNEAQRPIQERTTIPEPGNYTLILREDRTFSGKADRNEISGTY